MYTPSNSAKPQTNLLFSLSFQLYCVLGHNNPLCNLQEPRGILAINPSQECLYLYVSYLHA